MALERKNRNPIPERNPIERAQDFKEVSLGYSAKMAMDEATRCLNCKNAPCVKGCPVGVQIPTFISLVADGKFLEAGQIIKETNFLPSVCGRVCPQERQCESKCVRAKMEGAVSIGALERFVGDYMLEHEEKTLVKDKIGKKAAIIGSGPSGLSCAGLLAKNGVEVTVYEAFHRVGGVLTYGIPEFRLPKKLVEAEAGKLKDLGVKFELNTVVGKTVTLDEILDEFDAAFIGSGAGLPQFMGIKGENLNGVYSANEYLTRINLMGAYDSLSATPVKKGDKVVVIGAGNVAMDAARTAKRMGASEVTVVYRRGREEMPARKAEIHHAEEEGIVFKLLTNPVEYQGENGWVKKLKCVKMELTEPDASGRRKPIAIKGSEFDIETDMVIVALGTSPNPLLRESCANLKTEGNGILVVDENMMTSVDRVYAGGDAVTGAATVILAMGAGKRAAEAILKRFQA